MLEIAKQIREIIMAYYEKIDPINDEIDRIRRDDRLNGNYKAEAVAEQMNLKLAAEQEARAALEEVEAAARVKIREKYNFVPEDITDDVKILQIPITLTADELCAIYDRNESATMKTIVARYAAERGIFLDRKQIGEAEALDTLNMLTGGYFNSAIARPGYRDQWLDDRYLEKLAAVG